MGRWPQGPRPIRFLSPLTKFFPYLDVLPHKNVKGTPHGVHDDHDIE